MRLTNRILTSLILLLTLASSFTSCDDDDTYADRRKREGRQIASFLQRGCEVMDADKADYLLRIPGNIKVISEETFYAQDSTTNVSENEYVLFKNSGVYMQVVRRGTGVPLADGTSAKVYVRYAEYNIATDTLQTTNRILYYALTPDVMNVQNKLGNIIGSFESGVMPTTYRTKAVPEGWLVPLHFVSLGRETSAENGVALVRIIVPSTQGQADAMNNTYPTFYELSYTRGR